MDNQDQIQDQIKTLEKRVAFLQQEKEKVIKDIQNKHPAFHSWMKRSGFDFNNLAKHSAQIAAALTIVLSPTQLKIEYTPKPPDTTGLTPVVKVIEREELKGIDEEQKAKLVKERYGHIIDRVAEKYGIDPNLILATIMLESGGDTMAIRHEPAINDASYGLGQILYGTARLLGFEGKPEQLFDPEVNIELIGRYHKRNLDTYGSELTPQELTVAYNSGSPYNSPYPGHINKFNKWFERVGQLLV